MGFQRKRGVSTFKRFGKNRTFTINHDVIIRTYKKFAAPGAAPTMPKDEEFWQNVCGVLGVPNSYKNHKIIFNTVTKWKEAPVAQTGSEPAEKVSKGKRKKASCEEESDHS